MLLVFQRVCVRSKWSSGKHAARDTDFELHLFFYYHSWRAPKYVVARHTVISVKMCYPPSFGRCNSHISYCRFMVYIEPVIPCSFKTGASFPSKHDYFSPNFVPEGCPSKAWWHQKMASRPGFLHRSSCANKKQNEMDPKIFVEGDARFSKTYVPFVMWYSIRIWHFTWTNEAHILGYVIFFV